jgi:hypothetical protein
MGGIMELIEDGGLAYPAQSEIKKLRDLNGWISVKDGLPQYDCEVLVVYHGYVTICEFQLDPIYPTFYHTSMDERLTVTHWMPLPEPPKVRNQVYLGLNGTWTEKDWMNSVGTSVLFKTKDEKIFQLGIGVVNRTFDGYKGEFVPYLNGGVYWKIRIKKD